MPFPQRPQQLQKNVCRGHSPLISPSLLLQFRLPPEVIAVPKASLPQKPSLNIFFWSREIICGRNVHVSPVSSQNLDTEIVLGLSPCDLKFPPHFLSFCFQIGNPLTQSLFIYFLPPLLKCKNESYLDIRENNTKQKYSQGPWKVTQKPVVN